MRTTRCRTCSAEIIWAVKPDGHKIPLDAEPELRWLLDEEGATRAVATYQNHQAKCPYAGLHRRKK